MTLRQATQSPACLKLVRVHCRSAMHVLPFWRRNSRERQRDWLDAVSLCSRSSNVSVWVTAYNPANCRLNVTRHGEGTSKQAFRLTILHSTQPQSAKECQRWKQQVAERPIITQSNGGEVAHHTISRRRNSVPIKIGQCRMHARNASSESDRHAPNHKFRYPFAALLRQISSSRNVLEVKHGRGINK